MSDIRSFFGKNNNVCKECINIPSCKRTYFNIHENNCGKILYTEKQYCFKCCIIFLNIDPRKKSI